ncbi:hypothetical protein [Limosilactobacillus fermentum]|uniref:hypothetical protein n=1 Tax=Limosilactobacillus fermentum TaxID=1613 RepID=UPI000FECB4CD|nr:hypothetical protein [Limosilactobacillus fermentum]QAR22355.1 hypothetical protein EQG50_07800 [Limosilactobacillus fermentum]
MTKEMVQFTIQTSGKNGGATWNSPYTFIREAQHFDVEDLKITLFMGQRLNFDDVNNSKEKYWQASTDGSCEDFLQWCKDNDYIDDYTTESYTVEGNN